MTNQIQIVRYAPKYEMAFHDLNMDWIRTFFQVETQDIKVLCNPKDYIIDRGGEIFMAIQDGQALGTVAMLKIDEKSVELGKMAVSPSSQGKGIGNTLLKHAINYARDEKYESIILYSNTILNAAIKLYRKYGFKEIPLEVDGLYERSNIKMELRLI